MSQDELARIEAIRAKYEAMLMRKPNVVGVAVGMEMKNGQSTGKPALIVMVSKKVPIAKLHPQAVIPRMLEGVIVDVQEVGEIRAV